MDNFKVVPSFTVGWKQGMSPHQNDNFTSLSTFQMMIIQNKKQQKNFDMKPGRFVSEQCELFPLFPS